MINSSLTTCLVLNSKYRKMLVNLSHLSILLKGAIAITGAAKILALPERGGEGLTHARIFLVNWTFNIHSVQNN